MSGKCALIIGNTEYSESELAQLFAPGKGIQDAGGYLFGLMLQQVLRFCAVTCKHSGRRPPESLYKLIGFLGLTSSHLKDGFLFF
jgi:hypothetical protein